LSAVNACADSDDNSVAYNYYRKIESNNGLYGLVAAGSAIGATFTYLFLLFYGNNMPKKDEIQIASFLYFIGGLFESESGSLSWHYDSGLTLFLFGRLIYGAGIALSFHSVLSYVSEYSPPKYRGILGTHFCPYTALLAYSLIYILRKHD
jgi:MFS family permease